LGCEIVELGSTGDQVNVGNSSFNVQGLALDRWAARNSMKFYDTRNSK